MSRRILGAGLLVITAMLSACNKSSNESKSNAGNGVTPQTYPAPGLTFYADSNYTNVDIDDSIYFGNRNAVMYYMGTQGFGGRNATNECNQFLRAGRNGPVPLAYSRMGGFENRWRAAGTRRYGRVNSRRGDSLGQVQSWKLRDGSALQSLNGGSYVVCLVDRNRQHEAMGMFFEANAQMQTQVSFNMSFQNYGAQFSGPYYQKGFQQQQGRGGVIR
jgi:hypothetical protein